MQRMGMGLKVVEPGGYIYSTATSVDRQRWEKHWLLFDQFSAWILPGRGGTVS